MNEDSDSEIDSDEGNREVLQMEMKKTRVRKRVGDEFLIIRKEDTREDIKDTFKYLSEEMNEMKGFYSFIEIVL